MTQTMIVVTGVLAIWLSQDALESRRKWAPILGLIGQPFWFYAAYTTEQWGIFVLCFFYTAAWAKGLYTYWKPTTAGKPER
jgi:nicotinamide riboside transporter PnuC